MALLLGAGKTCTMIGGESVGPGVMVLTMRDIFAAIDARNDENVRVFF